MQNGLVKIYLLHMQIHQQALSQPEKCVEINVARYHLLVLVWVSRDAHIVIQALF